MSDDMSGVTPAELDDWATNAAGPVALRLKQKLLSVEESGIIFPPTYADIGYNIDTLSDGTCVATIDSVGSQANRLEPVFKSDSTKPEVWLVPQIQIVIRKEACGECDACKNAAADASKRAKKNGCTQPREVARSLLDLAHRAADAVVQSSPDLLKILGPAFQALQQGDAGPLCAIAPTSLVFGVWDSRGETGEKRPRLVRSIIRAWDVEPLHAAAQFNSVWKLLDEEQQEALTKEAKAKKVDLSQKGLADTPSVFRPKLKIKNYVNDSVNSDARVLGGVLVRGRIERDITVNLVALRGLRGKEETETDAIRKYLLGLSLVAATTDMELFLREGCLLRYAETDQWYQVPRRGEPAPINLGNPIAMEYAKAAASHFREKWPKQFQDKWPNLKYDFNLDEAKNLLAKKGAEDESSSD
jgi:CRISPR-associated protein Csb1